MSLSRKDFKAIAWAFAYERAYVTRILAPQEAKLVLQSINRLQNELATTCGQHNQLFSRAKFVEACSAPPC